MAPCLALFLIWAGASLFLLLEPVNGDAEYKENWKYCRNKDLKEPYQNFLTHSFYFSDFARCYFPFIYHNKVYDNCTTLGSFNGKPWCSLSPNYDEDKVWKYC
ncbi:Seminal plasma protein A3 [Camelus dromedarius]|uniref:Seminal plasma protein A3 n=1 Tax=Camelus dromedarius TaxID=9838 RepID=A0A5N4DRA4_CAMDR|nr:Seminal plasma protein A3 [Camelus dromedarius]